MAHLSALLLIIILLSQSFIDLELVLPVDGWTFNAPIADWAAVLLLPIAAVGWLRGERAPLPGWAGYGLMLLAAALSVQVAISPEDSFHHLIRKPLFFYLAYGVGLVWVVRRVRAEILWGALIAWALSTASLSLLTSISRIGAGDALWFADIAGLTPNHKTLAVGLSTALPLLIGRYGSAPRRILAFSIGLSLAAILLSASKTAWIIAVFSVAFFLPRSRPIACRPHLVLPALILALALAYYAPILLGSKTMLDAARSRHSLNERAWMMFTAHPLVGSGTGMNVLVEQVTFPHYRVNGVDAHGVIQKVGSETGLLGLAGYGWFSLASLLAIRRRWTEDGGEYGGEYGGRRYGALGCVAALQVSLLLSTETFSQTWWIPFAVAWGQAHREEE